MLLLAGPCRPPADQGREPPPGKDPPMSMRFRCRAAAARRFRRRRRRRMPVCQRRRLHPPHSRSERVPTCARTGPRPAHQCRPPVRYLHRRSPPAVPRGVHASSRPHHQRLSAVPRRRQPPASALRPRRPGRRSRPSCALPRPGLHRRRHKRCARPLRRRWHVQLRRRRWRGRLRLRWPWHVQRRHRRWRGQRRPRPGRRLRRPRASGVRRTSRIAEQSCAASTA